MATSLSMTPGAIKARKYRLTYPHKYLQSQFKYKKTNPEKYLLNLAKKRALYKYKCEFTLKVEDIVIPTHCPLLGIKLDMLDLNIDTHPSIDRIDSTKGYIKTNIMIISHRANRLKNNSTSTELTQLANNLKKYESIS